MELDLGHSADRDGFSFRETFTLPTEEGGEALCAVAVEGTSSRTGSRYYVDAAVTGTLTVDCSRCLGPYEHPVDVAFRLVLQRGAHDAPPESIEDDDFVFLDERAEYAFDLFPRVREAVILDLPIRFLCDDGCRGLCPACGANLNEGDCGCEREEGDPRWGALRKLLNRSDES
ncbi:MAG: DUF177 domain-containing protein [Candidatus Krumholzibacteriota bacterium]|nr:DUF177 domain-containing protein [Candidatus Krumholzibacteriota bacterium]